MGVSHGAVWLIRLYQRTLSRVLPNVCRFQPTCSQYAVEAYERHGFWRGSWLALRRLLRCHPFNPGGPDPVPGEEPGIPNPESSIQNGEAPESRV